ncbi:MULTISPECIES: hypothetical protein [Pseudomonas]|uniref:Uncharacterized protein n=1 Tax=Pseudomonas quercus TaxID=2722792 RepID=A0ABX0YFY9_9PSED|nr:MULTISPECIES: hypothetical protein [Pseudomonas]MBF7144985.1 hypothetical protein [Pseudomonas sp. LY10J]NJP01284.1 hypothetical protein [Pseudomonas quercus]
MAGQPLLHQPVGYLDRPSNTNLTAIMARFDQAYRAEGAVQNAEEETQFRSEQEILALTATTALPNAGLIPFESPRPAPSPPMRDHHDRLANRLMNKFAPPVTKKLHKDRPPPKPTGKESTATRLMNNLAPPVINRLQKDRPLPKPIGEESTASRLMDKLASPVTHKLQKDRPASQPTGQKGMVTRLVNKLAPPVSNKLKKKPPLSSSLNAHIVSDPLLMPGHTMNSGWSVSTDDGIGRVRRVFDRFTPDFKAHLKHFWKGDPVHES